MASKFSSAVTQFSAKFVNELDKDKSVVSSPLSAKFLLALVTLGTTGDSHEELLTALGLSDDEEIRQAFANVATKLKSISGVTLNVANKIYVKDGSYELMPALQEDAVKVFDAAFEKVNFNDSAAAAALINGWVENQTNKRIKDLLSPSSLDPDTRLVLVNAIYFKGTWKKQFNSSFTTEQPFYTAGSEIMVPMMYKEDSYRYGESADLQAKLLELPYIGDEAKMVIVLPDEVDGLNGMLAKLAGGYNLLADIDNMFSTKVQVSIPKFKIETEIDLKVLLPKIGIQRIFGYDSGLTKILNNNEELVVSEAVQKAFIEVNEEGAEAAAATAMAVSFCSAIIDLDPVKEFRADRPFLTVISSDDNTLLFFAAYRGE